VFNSQTGLSNHLYCKGCYLNDDRNSKKSKTFKHTTAEVIAFGLLIVDLLDRQANEQLQLGEGCWECDDGNRAEDYEYMFD